MGGVLKALGPVKIVLIVLAALAIVGFFAWSALKPPPAPSVRPADAGIDDPTLYGVADPLPAPPPPPPPARAPGRLAASQSAVYVAAGQGEAPARAEVRFENRGATPLRVEGMELSGDAAFALAASCDTLAAGAGCVATVLMSTANAGPSRAGLSVRWQATDDRGTAIGGKEELKIAFSGDVRAPATPLLPPIADVPPRDWSNERLAEQRRARAEASAAVIASRPPEGAVERGDPALVRRRADVDAGTATLSQRDYGAGFPRRVASLPVDRARVVTADRFIEAVLISSINSRLPGEIRATVARNVMGASGRLVLIPARSSLIGRYEGVLPQAGGSGNRSPRAGDVRLAVRWTRIIRPDGAHVLIDDAGYDAMGRSGLIGEVDNRMFERFFGAALISTVTVAGAVAQGLLSESEVAYESVVQNGLTVLIPKAPSRAAQATRDGMRQGIDRLSTFAEQMLREGMTLEPIITIPQGTKLFVIPREDIWIPGPEDEAQTVAAGAERVARVRRPEAPPAAAFGSEREAVPPASEARPR